MKRKKTLFTHKTLVYAVKLCLRIKPGLRRKTLFTHATLVPGRRGLRLCRGSRAAGLPGLTRAVPPCRGARDSDCAGAGGGLGLTRAVPGRRGLGLCRGGRRARPYSKSSSAGPPGTRTVPGRAGGGLAGPYSRGAAVPGRRHA
jgi:hypothetical protein